MSNPTDAETGEMRPHIPNPTLDAIRQRADAATPGPWTPTGHYPQLALQSGEDNMVSTVLAGNPLADAEFIAHAREDIPALVAALNAVLRLHGADSYGNCCECGGEDDPQGAPWPCLTVRDIRAALNGEAIA